MKKLILYLALSCLFLVSAYAQNGRSFSFMALGDMPYFLPEDYTRFDNVISQINQQNPAFTLHVGDFKASSVVCSDEYFTKMVNYFQSFSKPLIYTPGDNEWTDCNKKEAGSYDPHERLQKVRTMFFKDSKSFGKEKMVLTSQSASPAFSKFVENSRWDFNGVQFATFHAVGTSNNKVAEDQNRLKEFEERDAADLAWLEETFKIAKETNKVAIVLGTQADMFNPSKGPVGFENLIAKLTSLSIDFGKPVLLINGDSHRFIVDKPLVRPVDPKIKKSRVVENFTRVQVFGEQDMHAVKITFNPDLPGLFQIDQFFVKGN